MGPGRAFTGGNVGDPGDCERVVREVIEQHGRLDILVNNAGVTVDRPILGMTVDDWHKVLRVNLSGAFYMSKPALEHMIERGSGRIINISSITGEIGNIGQANYAASKSGLFGFTKTLAREAAFALAKAGRLADDSAGLTVNVVTPGLIETDMTATVPAKVIASFDIGDPDAPHGPPRGGRSRRGLPGLGRIGLHHRPGVGRQRRTGHVRPKDEGRGRRTPPPVRSGGAVQALASERSADLSILPMAFVGSSSSTSMSTGRLYLASSSVQSASRSSAVMPGRAAT